MDSFDIRFSEMSDLEYLAKWFLAPNATDDFPFGEKEKEEALKNWIGFSKFKASLTGTFEGTPCSVGALFLMPYKKVAHHASFYLFVDPLHRKKGIGSSMVKNLLNLGKTRFRLESLHAELFDFSKLLSILERQNFKQFARQEGYVKMEDGTYRARILLEHFFS